MLIAEILCFYKTSSQVLPAWQGKNDTTEKKSICFQFNCPSSYNVFSSNKRDLSTVFGHYKLLSIYRGECLRLVLNVEYRFKIIGLSLLFFTHCVQLCLLSILSPFVQFSIFVSYRNAIQCIYAENPFSSRKMDSDNIQRTQSFVLKLRLDDERTATLIF